MARRPPSPRVALAARLYASGAVATKGEAGEAAGLNGTYFRLVSSPGAQRSHPEVRKLMEDVDAQIHDKTVEMSAILQHIGREALVEMRRLMHASNNEAIKLKAASDLLDRSTETSKIHKHQVASFSVSGDDAKMLAAAMVESAKAREQYPEAASGDFVKVPIEDAAALSVPEDDLHDARERLFNGPQHSSEVAAGEAAELKQQDRPASQASEGPATQDHATERRLKLVQED